VGRPYGSILPTANGWEGRRVSNEGQGSAPSEWIDEASWGTRRKANHYRVTLAALAVGGAQVGMKPPNPFSEGLIAMATATSDFSD